MKIKFTIMRIPLPRRSGWTVARALFLLTLCLASHSSVALENIADFSADQSAAPAPPKKRSDDVEFPPTISSSFRLSPVVDGSFKLENPSGRILTFGNLAEDNNIVISDLGNSSPDQNVYLKLDKNPGGPTPGYDYGRHFLFQGHEVGGGLAYITRINLDIVDPKHKITLLTPVDPLSGRTDFNNLDGSAYNPFTRKLLFTEERSDEKSLDGAGRVIEVNTAWPSRIETLEAQLGFGGFEGIRVDNTGALYLQEDIKGKTSRNRVARIGDRDVVLDKARQPGSFVYRFLPSNPERLQDGGKMQAMQVHIDGRPLTFNASDPDADILADAQKKLYSTGSRWPFKWMTIREIPPNAAQSYNATHAARNAGATPFKRPENMAWLPNSGFRTFFFSVTGDNQIIPGMEPELAARGAWGAIFRVDQEGGRTDGYDGYLSLFVLGDAGHAGFDNIAFMDDRRMLVAEDRNDALHDQLKLYDSVWAYDVHTRADARFIAAGVDRFCCGISSSDNEPSGLTVSNGSTEKKDMIGTIENFINSRLFITLEHGKNRVYEIIHK